MKSRSKTHLINSVSDQRGTRFPTLTKLLALLLTTASLAEHEATALPSGQEDGMRALIRADSMRVSAGERPEMLLAALEMLAIARGRVLTPDGAPADVGYDALYESTIDVLAAHDYPKHLLDRLAKLPGIDRGATGGVKQIDGAIRHQISFDVIFRGSEDAMVYVRGELNQPIALSVVESHGRVVCAKTRAQGRAFCSWRPDREQRVRIRATYKNPDTRGRIEVFTN